MIVLGQRFFVNFPLAVVVDREKGTYSLSVGGAVESSHNLELLIIIMISVTLSVLIMLFVV